MRFAYTLPWDGDGRLRPRKAVIDLDHPDDEDLMVRAIRATRCFYEIELLEYIALRGPRGGVFLDVGANIGNHSVYFGKFLADRVVAVEPTAAARRSLERNLETNGVESFAVAACGVGAAAGRARVFVPAEEHPHNLGAARLEPAGDGDADTVPIRTLDQIVAEHAGAPVTFVKIDVEGMEMDVLRGSTRLLEEYRPQLCIELSCRDAYVEVTRHLAGLGYRPAGPFCVTPTFCFAVDGVHPRRARPSPLAYRLVRSWTRGRLSRLRRRGP